VKCENCPYLKRTSYEYGDYECAIFGDEPPKEYMTEEGCNIHWKKLKKMYDKQEEDFDRYWNSYANYIAKKQEKLEKSDVKN